MPHALAIAQRPCSLFVIGYFLAFLAFFWWASIQALRSESARATDAMRSFTCLALKVIAMVRSPSRFIQAAVSLDRMLEGMASSISLMASYAGHRWCGHCSDLSRITAKGRRERYLF